MRPKFPVGNIVWDVKVVVTSEHIKFNYVESPYSLKISFWMILCLSSLQLDVI
jgi:hypothetical protein